jgi:hypothetical protein
MGNTAKVIEKNGDLKKGIKIGSSALLRLPSEENAKYLKDFTNLLF